MKEIPRPAGSFKTKLGWFSFEFTSTTRLTFKAKAGYTVNGKEFTAETHGVLVRDNTGYKWFQIPYKDALTIKRKELMHEHTKAQWNEIKTCIEDGFNSFWKNDPLISKKHAQFRVYCERKIIFMGIDEQSQIITKAVGELNRFKQQLANLL